VQKESVPRRWPGLVSLALAFGFLRTHSEKGNVLGGGGTQGRGRTALQLGIFATLSGALERLRCGIE